MGGAVAPMLVGSAIGAVSSKNPLQGALLGGALGGAGGAFMQGGGMSNMFGSFADDAAAGILPSAASGSTTINAAAPMAGQAFTPGATSAMNAANLTTGPSGVLGVEGMKSAGGGIFSGGMANPAPFASSGTSTGLIPSSMYEPTVMERIGGGLQGVGQYAQQNPVLTGMALQSAQQMMQQPQAQMAPAGQVSRGQIQGGDYMSLLNPQQSPVIRPQPISLLG